MNQLDIQIYQDRIKREKEDMENSWENVKQFGFTEEMKPQILKNHVADYFSHILCTFKEDVYNEALRTLAY